MKNRLAELLSEAEGRINNDLPTLEQMADYLIEHGAIAPTAKIGDLLFCIIRDKSYDEKPYYHIEACRVNEIMYFGEGRFLYGVREINTGYGHNANLSINAFTDFEEAEKVLAERSKK